MHGRAGAPGGAKRIAVGTSHAWKGRFGHVRCHLTRTRGKLETGTWPNGPPSVRKTPDSTKVDGQGRSRHLQVSTPVLVVQPVVRSASTLQADPDSRSSDGQVGGGRRRDDRGAGPKERQQRCTNRRG